MHVQASRTRHDGFIASEAVGTAADAQAQGAVGGDPGGRSAAASGHRAGGHQPHHWPGRPSENDDLFHCAVFHVPDLLRVMVHACIHQPMGACSMALPCVRQVHATRSSGTSGHQPQDTKGQARYDKVHCVQAYKIAPPNMHEQHPGHAVVFNLALYAADEDKSSDDAQPVYCSALEMQLASSYVSKAFEAHDAGAKARTSPPSMPHC